MCFFIKLYLKSLFAEKEMTAYRLFISEIADRRKRERIEAAILINAYSSKEPLAEFEFGGIIYV